MANAAIFFDDADLLMDFSAPTAIQMATPHFAPPHLHTHVTEIHLVELLRKQPLLGKAAASLIIAEDDSHAFAFAIATLFLRHAKAKYAALLTLFSR